MSTFDWHPGSLLQLSGSYWQAFALHAAVKLSFFNALSKEPLSAEAVSQELQTDIDGTERLLNALCAMALIRKKERHYALTEAARRFLVETSEEYIGYLILHHHHLSPAWTRLDESVRTGEPQRQSASFSGGQQREAFLMGMFNQATQQASAVVEQIPLGERERLLDFGGGPGTYAIHFCLRNPDLSATVFDLPTTRPFAEKTISRYGLSDRIRFHPGDFIEDEIDGKYDVAWLSHILHGEGEADCRKLIAKAVASLSPNGLIFIHEFILDDDMDGPLFPALFSLNMLVGTEKGQAYSEAQLRQMLAEAGIDKIERMPYEGPTQSGILRGTVSRL